tara:strand:+ start:789 stop:1601 length:813 start_codon:yes stop_codon:yes gene_type:complete
MKDASWPHELSVKKDIVHNSDLSKVYYAFTKLSNEKFGRVVALKPHLLSETIYKLATDPKIINILKPLMGEDINIWSSAFFAKKPKSTSYVGYHQDAPFWQLSSDNVYSAWIALSESNKENGCLEFIAHTEDYTFDLDISNPYEAYKKGIKTSEGENLISFNQKIPKKIKEKSPFYVELKPGEFSIHKITVIHGSSPNKSNLPRIGLVIRYVDSKTHHLKDKNDSALNVIGKKSEYFEQEKRPYGEFTENNLVEYNSKSNTAGTFGNKQY